MAMAGCVSTGAERPPNVDSLGDSSTGQGSLSLGSLVTGIDDSPGTDAPDPSGTVGTATTGPTDSSDGTATSGSDDGSSSGDTTGGTSSLPEYCGDVIPKGEFDPLIDDLELERGQMLPDDQIPELEGRVGFWFTYNDGSPAGEQTPAPGSFQPSTGGASGSTYSAGTFGTGFVGWGAGMGVKLNNDFSGDCPYDASSFDGIAFQALGDVTARVSVSTRATLPIESGGTCDPNAGQCSDHFGAVVVLQPDWQVYEFAWSELTQQGWGIPVEFDPGQIVEIQWQVPVAIPFDVRVDEIEFSIP